jgi:chemotaxis protein CheD
MNGLSRVNIVQGEFYVSDNPNLVITTLVGSCIATCIFDPETKIGGMNHFLLPGHAKPGPRSKAIKYGGELMNLLIEELLARGANRKTLDAKIFGGANPVIALGTIGTQNAKFARDFLADMNITCTGGSVGGEHGRKVHFYPTTGKAKQMMVANDLLSRGKESVFLPGIAGFR